MTNAITTQHINNLQMGRSSTGSFFVF